ncbi:surface-adhesin E family protein [uncultured Acinetobacter sp.]|uniref:surface-adhesin E family protein n=1 Tax=uncultured Acinetobacter sp. TaxID=165433 RepID=UPI0026244895|nr:surface-adhesin E family protein [uncultured Acinetobacter sp.]
MKKLLLSLGLSSITTITVAQEWQLIAEDAYHQISLNTQTLESIQREQQNLLKVWTNWQVYTEQGPQDQLRGDFTMVMYYINCQTQSIAESSRTSYFANGLERSSKASTWHDLRPVAANSLAAQMIKIACQVKQTDDKSK